MSVRTMKLIESKKEPEVKDQSSDIFSSWIIDCYIKNEVIVAASKKRRQMWESINILVVANGGIPVYSSVSSQSSPWMYPFYAENKAQRMELKNKLIISGYSVVTWPSLPDEVLSLTTHQKLLNRWHCLLCVLLG